MFLIWILDHDLHTVVELAGVLPTKSTKVVAGIGALANLRFAYEREN